MTKVRPTSPAPVRSSKSVVEDTDDIPVRSTNVPGRGHKLHGDTFTPSSSRKRPPHPPGPTPSPSTNDTGKLANHGGGVLTKPNIVPVYVGSYWNSTAGQSDRQWNDSAMADLVKNPGMVGIWKQYGTGAGTTGTSQQVNTASDPKLMTQADVEALVSAQVKAGTFDTSNPQTIFTLALPPGCELQNGQDSSHAGLGGYHGSVNVNGKEVYYAVVCYSQTQNGQVNGIDFTGKGRDNVTITESHEISEAVSDPNVGVAVRTNDNSKLGWYDDTTKWKDGRGTVHRGKGEIGDITILNSELDGDQTLATAWGRSDGFAFQKEWSNQDGQSELAPKSAGTSNTGTGKKTPNT